MSLQSPSSLSLLAIYNEQYFKLILWSINYISGISRNHAITDIIFVTSSTSSASVKYFWICVKLYRINTLLEGKCVKIITQDVSNCKENYTRG